MFISTQHTDLPQRYFRITALAVAGIVICGFAPLYTLRLLRHDPLLTLLVQAHGLVMMSWIALFVVQTQLIARGRPDLHRKLGPYGAALIVGILAIGVAVLVNAATRKAHGAQGAPFYLRLVAFDGVNLMLFACLAASAVAMRARGDYHKRLMLLATLSLLGPAFGRLTSYANGLRGDNDLAVLLLMLACLGIAASVDLARLRRLHPAWIFGALPVAAADLLTYVAKTRL